MILYTIYKLACYEIYQKINKLLFNYFMHYIIINIINHIMIIQIFYLRLFKIKIKEFKYL